MRLRGTGGAVRGGLLSVVVLVGVAASEAGTLTIGETNVLPTDDSGNGDLLLAQQATLSQAATIQSISFYVTTAAGDLRLGIYDASGPGGGPGARKAETASFTPVSGWNTPPVLAPVVLTAGTYWLAYFPSSSGLGFRATGTGTAKYYALAYGPMPATFSTSPTTGSFHWSLYATLDTAPPAITMGETSVLAGDDCCNSALLLAQQASLAQTATLQSVSFYVTSTAGSLRLGVYDATGPGGGPGAKRGETSEITPVTGWNAAPVVSPVPLPAGTYWLAYAHSNDPPVQPANIMMSKYSLVAARATG